MLSLQAITSEKESSLSAATLESYNGKNKPDVTKSTAGPVEKVSYTSAQLVLNIPFIIEPP